MSMISPLSGQFAALLYGLSVSIVSDQAPKSESLLRRTLRGRGFRQREQDRQREDAVFRGDRHRAVVALDDAAYAPQADAVDLRVPLAGTGQTVLKDKVSLHMVFDLDEGKAEQHILVIDPR